MASVDVKPDLLRWAIDRSGLSVDLLRGVFPKLEEWLTREKQPTLKQLQAFAKKTMVPFGYLFLSSPPEETLPLPDYRTRRDLGVRRPTPNLIDVIHDMQRRQDWMREYLLEEGHAALPFVGMVKVGDSITDTANAIRKTLSLGIDWARQSTTKENALRILRKKIESAGILIFLSGVVANNTSRPLNVDEFQGFVLADEISPLIFVNSADSKNAQMFTIAHELVHVWVGQSALFDNLVNNEMDVKLEKFCNRVAAEFLVPASQLKELLNVNQGIEHYHFHELAKRFCVSPIVVARRCFELKLVSENAFFTFYRQYMVEVKGLPKKASDGGNFWNTQNTRLGERFGRAVINAAREGRLSYSDAYSLTNLAGKTFDKYAAHLNRESAQ